MRWSSNAAAKRRGYYPADFAVNTVGDGIKASFRLPRGNQGALHLFLFGSVARDEANGDSDVDIFIDRDPAKNFELIELTGIGFLLEDVLAHPLISERAAACISRSVPRSSARQSRYFDGGQ